MKESTSTTMNNEFTVSAVLATCEKPAVIFTDWVTDKPGTLKAWFSSYVDNGFHVVQGTLYDDDVEKVFTSLSELLELLEDLGTDNSSSVAA